MAIQAQMYPENLGLPLSSQDWLFLSNNNNNMINNNNNLLYNGCGFNEFSFNNLQQKQQQQQQQQQQQLLYLQQQQQQQQYLLQLQNMQQRNSCDNSNNNNGFVFKASKSQNFPTTTATTTTGTTASTTTSGSDHMSMNFSQSLSSQIEKQRQEVDRYITLQNERLKLALQEQRKQQLAAIMRKLEEKAMQLLREKDDEIALATKRRMDLEEIMRKLEIENQAWQRLAAENEALVISLTNKLAQLKEQGCCLTSSSSSSNEVDDAESCCNVFDNNNNNSRGNEETGGTVAETGENRGVFGSEVLCRVCNSGKSCVLLLPCRHLCCCKACDAFVQACPVCKSAKMASIEALIS